MTFWICAYGKGCFSNKFIYLIFREVKLLWCKLGTPGAASPPPTARRCRRRRCCRSRRYRVPRLLLLLLHVTQFDALARMHVGACITNTCPRAHLWRRVEEKWRSATPLSPYLSHTLSLSLSPIFEEFSAVSDRSPSFSKHKRSIKENSQRDTQIPQTIEGDLPAYSSISGQVMGTDGEECVCVMRKRGSMTEGDGWR